MGDAGNLLKCGNNKERIALEAQRLAKRLRSKAAFSRRALEWEEQRNEDGGDVR